MGQRKFHRALQGKRFGCRAHGYQEAQPGNEEAWAQANTSARRHCVTLRKEEVREYERCLGQHVA